MNTERMPKRAAVWPHTIERLRAEVMYYPDTGVMITNSRYKTSFRRTPQGHMMLYLPVQIVPEIQKKYFRADHVAWALVDNEWPEGWIIPVNGIKKDLRLQNLIHEDRMGRRWWHMLDGTKVEVAREIIRVSDGDNIIVRPLMLNEPPEHDIDTDTVAKFGEEWGVTDGETEILEREIEGAEEPDTEGDTGLPELPIGGEDDSG